MRYSQEYWLRIQAKAALEKAMVLPEPKNIVFKTSLEVDTYVELAFARREILGKAAELLVEAEFIHRAMVSKSQDSEPIDYTGGY